MTDRMPTDSPSTDPSLLDELLRVGVPEIKLALGEVIDRENARPLPPRYARLLPDTVLTVTLRADAAEAVRPIATDLERELTDSCNRHGSLYDRRYRVRLHRAEDPDAPLYAVSVNAGREESAAPAPAIAGGPEGAPTGGERSGPATAARAAPGRGAEPPALLPVTDPGATVLAPESPPGWEDGRWVLVVEGDGGEEREAFRIAEPVVTVGRRSDDPGMRPSIAISDAPHVSRRQLALSWEERDGAPGFRIHNLGLNPVRLPGQEIPGAHVGRGAIDLSAIADVHTGWLPPGVPARIGEHGPTLRIDEIPPEADAFPVDPDATVFD